MKLKIFISAFSIGAFLMLSTVDADAQCSMCRRGAETNMENNQSSVGKNLNKGILYLLSVPYLLGGIALLAWYSEKKRKKNIQHNETLET